VRRIPATTALVNGFTQVLCRPPDDREAVRWESRPFETAELVESLRTTAEGEKVRGVRAIYDEVLRRPAGPKDCGSIRNWIDRGVGIEQAKDKLGDSPEGRRVTAVRRVFIDTLGRDPVGWDDASLRRWVDSPFTIAEIRSRLIAQRPLVGVHYFTWYRSDGGSWRNDLTTVPADSPTPALGHYTSADPHVIETQVSQMAAAGFDFVIVHIIAQSPASWTTARSVFDWLSGRMLKGAVMLDGLNTEDATAKASWVRMAKAEFAGRSNYFFFHGQPLVMLFSARLDFDVPGVALRNVYWADRYDPGRDTFNGDLRLYPSDWPFWAPTPQPAVNGVVPVIPGYIDSELGRVRTMEHPRRNGEMYHEQWRRALALHPELILVYSWNEYFERTAIEPTETWGDSYLRWTACYIAQAHRNSVGECR